MSNQVDELFSDESSFYGDDSEKSRLEELVDSYDPGPYWSDIHPYLLSTIQRDILASEKGANDNKLKNTPLGSDVPLAIPFTTLRRNAHSPNEPVDEFLARLPPSTTKEEDVGPWIFVSNPQRKSNPDEPAIAVLVRKGTALLDDFENRKAILEAKHDHSGSKSKAALTRKLNPLRRSLEQEIFALARKTGVVSGKWMMFITPDRVDRYWEAVAAATIAGELGEAAKVATEGGSGRPRLIAIYTRDYADLNDVKRVLEKLIDLGLVKQDERPIYYKCDVLTYLNIMADNPYGLKASMGSSRDISTRKVRHTAQVLS